MSSNQIELPDFEEMAVLIDNIINTSYSKSVVELRIKKAESDTVRALTLDEKYYKGGKPFSMEFIKSTFMLTGINDEITPMREELIGLSSSLDAMKMRLDLMKLRADIYRTESANQRKSLL